MPVRRKTVFTTEHFSDGLVILKAGGLSRLPLLVEDDALHDRAASPGNRTRWVIAALLWSGVGGSVLRSVRAQALEEVDAELAASGRIESPLARLSNERLGTVKPTSGVRKAIRNLLARDEVRARRGERALKHRGVRVVPQLRYWLQRVKFEAERVETLLGAILRENGAEELGDAPEPPALLVTDFFHQRLRDARQLVREGSYRQARKVAEALLTLDPDSPMAWELRRLARDAHGRAAAERLEPQVDVGRLVYEVGDQPEIAFRLINRSQTASTIDLERGNLGNLEIAITYVSLQGGARFDKQKVSLRTARDRNQIVLVPGEIWVQDVSSERLMDSMPLEGVVARVQIGGEFRPSRWGFEGKEDTNVPVTVSAGEFWVVPPGHKAGLDSPLKQLVAALVFGRGEAFLVGGQLSVWAGEKDAVLNGALVEVLMDSLEDLDATRLGLALSFLRQATGRAFKESEEWKEWWEEEREGERARGRS